MKTQMMVTIIVFFISTSVLAVTGRDNWPTIRSSRDILIQQPTFAGAFGPAGLFNACATDEEFRSKTSVSTCLSYRQVITYSSKGPYKDYICNHFESRHVNISRTYTQEECVKYDRSGECLEYDSVTSVYPTSFQLVVIESGSEKTGNFIFSKPYNIPSCY
jgi:hypothetical protein